MDSIIIKVSQDFTDAPGGRFRKDGPFSGEAFRDDLLIPKYESLKPGQKIVIDLDGGYGYGISFLEEAFGGLVRKLGKACISRLEFISNETPGDLEDIRNYMADAAQRL